MPQKTLNIPCSFIAEQDRTAIAYEALKQLQWLIKNGDEDHIIAYTPRTWKQWEHEITIVTEPDGISITSKMVHGELFDRKGKNKKFTEEFNSAFQQVIASADEYQIGKWKAAMAEMRQQAFAAEQEVRQIMNAGGGNMYATYGVMAANVIVFIVMLVSGINIMGPKPDVMIQWGGNYGSMTTNGEP